jgi:hypothetical protein
LILIFDWIRTCFFDREVYGDGFFYVKAIFLQDLEDMAVDFHRDADERSESQWIRCIDRD